MGRRAESTVKFADQSVRARIKDSAGQPQREWRIDGVRGLVLVTQPSGTGTFYAFYRTRHGKNRKLRIGEYPDVTLQEARRRSDEVRRAVEDGGDPVGEAQMQATGATFRELADMRFAAGDLTTGTVALYRELLRLNAKLGSAKPFDFLSLPAREIEPHMIVAAMDAVQKPNGAKRQADMLRFAASSVFKFAKGRKSVETNPAAGIALRHRVKAREHVPSNDDLAKLWRATFKEGNGLSPAMRLIFRLAIMTGQRRAEIAGACRSELHLEGPAPVWIIPGDKVVRGKVSRTERGRTKNGEEQRVPLSPQAVALWLEALAIPRPKGSEVVFPADLSKVKTGKAPNFPHTSPDAVTKAMHSLRAKIGTGDITVHDMRRAIATWCGNTGVRPDVVDRVLNHKPRDVTRVHYNHSTLDTLVRQALTAWANHVEALASGDTTGAGSNVVQLRASGAAA